MKKHLVRRTPIVRRPYTILDYLIFPKEMISEITDEEADMLFDYYWDKVQKVCGFRNHIVTGKKFYPKIKRMYVAVRKLASSWSKYIDFVFYLYSKNPYQRYPKFHNLITEYTVEKWSQHMAEEQEIKRNSVEEESIPGVRKEYTQSEYAVNLVLSHRPDLKTKKDVIENCPGLIGFSIDPDYAEEVLEGTLPQAEEEKEIER